MSTPLLESLSGGLGERLTERLLSPAFFFWAAGAAAYLRSVGKLDGDAFASWTDGEVVWAIVFALPIIVGSSVVAEYLQFPALRALEGYWPGRLRFLRVRLATRHQRRFAAWKSRWEDLAARFKDLSLQERAEYASLDRQLADVPERRDVMPTALGNIIRAAELHAQYRYGLAANLCWSRLWLVMPADAREDLAAARRRLDRRIEFLLWSLALSAWTAFTPWAVLAAAVCAVASYRAILSAAATWGDLFRASFDLYHRDLVSKLGWTLDKEEPMPRRVGTEVTLFLRRGERPKPPPRKRSGLLSWFRTDK